MFSQAMVPLVHASLWSTGAGMTYWVVAGAICALVCFRSAIAEFSEDDTGMGLLLLVLTPVAFWFGFVILPVFIIGGIILILNA